MRVLFIFLDGVGLGDDNPATNPFAVAHLQNLEGLLNGARLLASSAPFHGSRASLVALDASLGVEGLPQSATGQAVLLTGTNIPARTGEHYGPKPNPQVASYLRAQNLFTDFRKDGRSAALLNAYPPRYFQAVNSGRRLYSAIPLAVTAAGLPLFGKEDLFAGRAISADFTGAGWASMLGFPEAPVLSPFAAGQRLAQLAGQYDFSLLEYWSTDYAGHKQDMSWALAQLATFDEVIGGLLSVIPANSLVLITSDHGNMEDLSTRRHTLAKVPALLIGPETARQDFTADLVDLTGIAPAIRRIVSSSD